MKMTIPSVRLRKRVMSRIWSAMKRNRVNSRGSFSLVGCSVGFLRSYIEGKFEKGMTWENYGEWHVDHIRPCASFDLNDKEQVLQCFNWRNLQPMWASENMSKGSNYAQA
jgi:Uri superfamily endonuclease